MSGGRIATRYAKSLLDLAIEQNQLDAVVADVTEFNEAIKTPEIAMFLKSPIIKSEKKLSVFKSAFGGKLNDVLDKFIQLVIVKGREQYLPAMTEEFMQQYNDYKGVSGVTLVSATPITEEVANAIKSKLKSSSETKEEIDLEFKVDPSLIGGFKLEIGDKLYDASVAHKLELLRKEFTN